MAAGRLPHELIDHVLVHAALSSVFTRNNNQRVRQGDRNQDGSATSPYALLRTCALVSPAWRAAAQARLFSLVRLDRPQTQCSSLETTLAARSDLASCTRTLRIEEGLTPEEMDAVHCLLKQCTRLVTFVLDVGAVDFRILEPLKNSSTLTTLRVAGPETGIGSFYCDYSSNPLPSSLRTLSIPSVDLSTWIWPYVNRSTGEADPVPSLAWLNEMIEWLTLTGTIEPADWVSYVGDAISGQTPPGKLPYPFDRLKGINASIGSKTAVEELFPPSAPEMDRIAVVWHVAWRDFIERKPPWQDFVAVPPTHDPLVGVWFEEDLYTVPRAHRLEALYILPLSDSPNQSHLDELEARVGPSGDPSLQHLKTIFLHKQWKAVLRQAGIAELDGRESSKVEVVWVGSILAEEEEVVGGGVADEDVGIPEEMKDWMERRRTG